MSEHIKWLRTLCLQCMLNQQNIGKDVPTPCCVECSNKHVVADKLEKYYKLVDDFIAGCNDLSHGKPWTRLLKAWGDAEQIRASDKSDQCVVKQADDI